MNDLSDERLEEFQLLQALTLELVTDLKIIYQLLLTDDSQFHRRTFIRTLFSYVEGTIFNMKQKALVFARILGSTHLFSIAEINILEEKTYELDDKGEVIPLKAKLQLTQNLRFAFKAFATANSVVFDLPVNLAGWEAFKKTIKVRDRLMHPKQACNLFITDEERRTAELAFDWFSKNENKLEELVRCKLEQELRRKSELTDKLEHILNTEGEKGLRKALDAGEFDKWKKQ